MKTLTMIVAPALVLALSACGSDDEAVEAPPAQTSEIAPELPEPPPEPAVDPDERVESTVAGHLPVRLAGEVSLAPGSVSLDLSGGFVQIEAPAGAAVAPHWHDGYTALRGVEPATFLYAHNPAGDDGEDCPSLETMRVRIGAVEVLVSRRVSVPWEGEGPAYGDEIDLLIFGDADHAGFYVRKRFDHGDDYTDFCAAFGAPGDAFDMSASGTLAQARTMAGMVLSARENL